MEDKIFGDLAISARDRARKNIGLTIQLLDGDDEAIAALLMVVAADLLNGAAHYSHRAGRGRNVDEAFAHVLVSIIDASPKITASLKKPGRKQR